MTHIIYKLLRRFTSCFIQVTGLLLYIFFFTNKTQTIEKRYGHLQTIHGIIQTIRGRFAKRFTEQTIYGHFLTNDLQFTLQTIQEYFC